MCRNCCRSEIPGGYSTTYVLGDEQTTGTLHHDVTVIITVTCWKTLNIEGSILVLGLVVVCNVFVLNALKKLQHCFVPFCQRFFAFQELCYKISMNRSPVLLPSEFKMVFKKKSLLSAGLKRTVHTNLDLKMGGSKRWRQ